MLILRPQRIRRRTTEGLIEDGQRLDEAIRIIRWMDDALGAGWKRRMDRVDRIVSEDTVVSWIRRFAPPSKRMLKQFREYAQRFGYGKITTAQCRANLRAGKFADVAAALDTLENPPPSPEACRYTSDPSPLDVPVGQGSGLPFGPDDAKPVGPKSLRPCDSTTCNHADPTTHARTD
jgi:hypothetical protein